MDLLTAWVVFPLVLGFVFAGAGLALEAISGRRLPGSLLLPAGFAVCVVAGQVTTLWDATAEATAPLLVVIALAGWGAAWLGRRPFKPPLALIFALAAVFAVYAAPIVMSGDPTVAGFIKLDDTATWLAFTDRIMEHGRDLSGLTESTYRRTLEVNIGEGYPIGVFVPFGAGSELTGLDPARVIQPYMALLAVLLALSLWSLVGRLVENPWARGAIVAVASQPALLYGYYLWGGVKEIAAAATIAAVAGLAAFALAHSREPRTLAPLAVGVAALAGILSPGGLIWLLPLLIALLVAVVREAGPRAAAIRAAGFTLAVSLMLLPVLAPGSIRPPTSSPLSDGAARGNLIEPLDPLQIAGIWPANDFRLDASGKAIVIPLIIVALALAVFGLARAWERRAMGLAGMLFTVTAGSAVLIAVGSPWVDGKALATASPLVLAGALAGTAAVSGLISRAAGIGLAVALAAGVTWSNALAYQGASLAPARGFAELEEIGEAVAGEGPTLMTEYSPYGARHFLRESAPESLSELRYRLVPLVDGMEAEKGSSADTDDIDPASLAVYRTLVLRRSPAQSRPPAAYELVWQGERYEAWQRAAGMPDPQPRIALGSLYDPVARPACSEVRALAAGGGDLLAATGRSPLVLPLGEVPAGDQALPFSVPIEREREYEIWLGGSVGPETNLTVDGEVVASVRNELTNQGGYIPLGSVSLDAGPHELELAIGGSDALPGSAGLPYPVGPLVLSETEAADSRVVRVAAEDADELCGREWDWIEAEGV